MEPVGRSLYTIGFLYSLEGFMSSLPHVLYVELLVPSAQSEQEFLLRAVQVALRKYRDLDHKDSNPSQLPSHDKVAFPQSIG